MIRSTPLSGSPSWWRASPYVALLFSALVPGAGQVYAGRRRRGAWMLSVSAVIVIVALLVLRDETTWLTWSVQPTALRWLLAGNGAVLAFRVFAAADAYRSIDTRTTKPPGTPGAVTVVALVVGSLAVLTVPHAIAGYYDIVQYDLITTVFAPTPDPPAPPPTVTNTSSAPTPTPGPDGPPAPGTAPPVPTATTTSTTTTTTIPPRLWDGTERLNVLLLGGDGAEGRSGVRTDTIILASIDPGSGHTALFSVPRNMARVPLPEEIDVWDCDCFPGIINALWRWATDRPGRFPDLASPNSDALKLAIGTLVDLEVHYYAMINLAGFVELVDALGGIDITVPRRLVEPNYSGPDGFTRSFDIAPGEYHMDGQTALAYSRARQRSDDYSRMDRQRCVLRAVAAQADPVTVIKAFPAIANAIKNNLFTDIPLERLPDFIELIPKIDADEIVSVRFVPPRYTGARTSEGYNTPDLEEIRSVVSEVLSSSPDRARENLQLENLDEACG